MKRNLYVAWIAASLSAASIPEQATAAPLIREEPEIARCIRQAAQGSTWLEKTLWGLRDQEAGWVGAEVANANGTLDLGVMQVNSSWVSRIAQQTGRKAAQIHNLLIYNACFNIRTARWVFFLGLSKNGNYWQAVGVYHSLMSWRQQRYIVTFVGKLRQRFVRGCLGNGCHGLPRGW